MATTASPPPPTKSGLFRKVTKKLKAVVDGEGAEEGVIRPARAGTLRSKAREQMRTGHGAEEFQFGDTQPGRKSLTIGDDGYGNDGRLYVKNLDESYPAPTSYELSPSSSGGGPPPLPTLSSIRAVTNQNQHLRDPSAALSQSPYSLPLQDRSQYDAPPTSSTIGFSDPNSLSPASAFRTPRAAPRRPSEPPEPFAQPRAPPSPPRSQGRARSQSQSQPTRGGGGGGRFDASDAPPMPGKGGSDMTESYAPVVPRSRSGPDQRATTSGEFSRAGGGGGGEAEIGGWGKVKRSMTLVKRSGRAEARAAKAAARDPNRSPSPPRVAAAPKMYTAAQLAVEMEKAARDAETEEQRAYRASCLTMGPRLAAAEAKESSRLAESFF